MRHKRRRRSQVSGWKVIRRCVVFFTAVCIIPVVLVLLVATDHYMRSTRHGTYVQQTINRQDRIIFDPPLNQNMAVVWKRLETRRKHMKRMCKLLGLDKPGNDTMHRPNPWEFLVDNKHHLVWCNIFKAASTSWMYNFNILAGYSPKFLKKTKLVPLNLARQKYPRPSLQALKQAFNVSISFLIARHPLERLLSAYRDKLQYSLPYSYHRKLGAEIVMKYRYKMKKQNGQKHYTNRIVPSFPEFVEYLVDSVKRGEKLDMHWTPIAEFCTPCMFDFKVIAHTETLQEDQMYLIKIAQLEHLIQPEWRNAGKGTTSAQVAKYYSQLARSQILQLYHIYRYDFELFNYSIQGYIELGMPDKDPSTLLAAITMKDFRSISENNLPKIY